MTTNHQTEYVTVKRFSFVRVFIFCVLIGVGVYGAVINAPQWEAEAMDSKFEPWFASYVDVTSTPTYSFEKRESSTKSNDVVLAFIVASPKDTCVPTWGGYYTAAEAAETLDLDRRIARLQQQGGKIAISFGGALNSELALVCNDEQALLLAYKSVIDRYNVSTIDLDLENESLRNVEAGKRRAQTIARLQAEYLAEGKKVTVWLTLPVAPQGLTSDGIEAVRIMLAENVDIAGYNLMTMDYGESKEKTQTMFEASKLALVATHRQIGILYKEVNQNPSSDSLWSKIGATPMLGQNDVRDEIFTLDDAQLLNTFAREQGIGRMSVWSANRDIPCGENYVDVKIVSDVCSGVSAPAFAYSEVLSAGFEGDLMQQAKMINEDIEKITQTVDDPATSPYQIWRDTGIYLKSTKVVWRGNVYEAKWWTRNDLPDNPVLQAWETPWQLIGPVLPTDKPMEQLVLPPRIFPAWSGRVIYDAGDRIVFDGVAFRAKWWNQGESPAAAGANPESSPWIPLTDEQVKEIISSPY